jgi:long-chain acyl-CoA synthetase
MTAHWLLDRLAEFGDRPSIVHRDQPVSYGELMDRIAEWHAILDRYGLHAGSVIAVRSDYSPDVCALFFAVALHRRVVVPLSTDEAIAHHLQASHARALFDFGNASRGEYTALSPAQSPPILKSLQDRTTPGLVVFSSGTTGRSKAALFDFDRLVQRYRTPRRGARTLVFLRLDHLGGIHTMLHTLAHGGTLVIGQERRPEDVVRAIERHRIEILPTTPTFLRMLLLSRGHERWDLSSLRLITFGTEPMPQSTLGALRRALPGATLKQTYGVTEVGVLPTRSRASDSLWLEVGGVGCEARVVDDVLWVRSPTAMLGYLDAPSPFDHDGWYNTQDVVEVDGPYIRILGRSTDLINVAGQKVYPSEVESVLLEMDNVSDATVWAERNPVTGQVVAARVSLVEPEDQQSLERRVHCFCRGRLADYKIPAVVEIAEHQQHGQRFKKIRPAATATA